jgi:hypothetical protein
MDSGEMYLLLISGIFDKLFKKKKEEPWDAGEVQELEQHPGYQVEEGHMPGQGPDSPEFFNEPSDFELEAKINYVPKKLEYRLRVRNASNDMLGDVTVNLKSQKKLVVTCITPEKVVEMLEPEKAGILKFKLKPKYRSGKSSIFGKLSYFDFKSKERKVVRLPPAHVNFELGKITGRRIDEDQWRVTCGGLMVYELETEVLEIPPNKLFNIFKRVLENIGLFPLPPIENENLYRGVAKFYGENDSGEVYTVEAQVIGDKKHSKVLFRVWCNEGRGAMALAYKTLDTIENIFKIKKFIVET